MSELACVYTWTDGCAMARCDGELIVVDGCTPGTPVAIDVDQDVVYEPGQAYFAAAEFRSDDDAIAFEAGYLCLDASGNVLGRAPCLLAGERVGNDWVLRKRPVRLGGGDDFARVPAGVVTLQAYISANNGADSAGLEYRNWRIVAMPRVIEEQD